MCVPCRCGGVELLHMMYSVFWLFQDHDLIRSQNVMSPPVSLPVRFS